MTDIPMIHPARKPPRFRPFKAMAHMNRLLADKEDTEQVFHIIDALNGRSLLRDLKAFAATPEGARLIAARDTLPAMLDDHDALRAYPAGSVADHYVRFMEREGLTAQGLVDESEKYGRPKYDDVVEWYGNRLRDTHDLFHVLTGYGRDGLGEAALLAFSHEQNGGRGVLFIAWMGCRQITKSVPRHIDIKACYQEGRANGRAARKIVREDVRTLLSEPLEAARARLNIKPPVAYRRALEQIQALDPTMLARAA